MTRFWHWTLASVVITNWVFGEFMSFDTVIWHFYLGYTVLGLLVLRLFWGFAGQHRFAGVTCFTIQQQ